MDYRDPEMSLSMSHACCWFINWGSEGADEEIRKRVRKGTTKAEATMGLSEEHEQLMRRQISHQQRLAGAELDALSVGRIYSKAGEGEV